MNSLEDIDQIGEFRAEKLQKRGFNSPSDFSEMSREELMEIDFVGEKLADRIYTHLNG